MSKKICLFNYRHSFVLNHAMTHLKYECNKARKNISISHNLFGGCFCLSIRDEELNKILSIPQFFH